jgi:Zn-dependent metalloprotease
VTSTANGVTVVGSRVEVSDIDSKEVTFTDSRAKVEFPSNFSEDISETDVLDLIVKEFPVMNLPSGGAS